MNTHSKIRFLDRTTPPHILTLVLMAGISAMTMNVFLPALPEMTEYFDTNYVYMQLSIGVFMGMNAALQLVVGPMSDRFGRRPVALIGVFLFIIATYAAMQATTIQAFLILRGAQAGVVTAMVLSRAVVRDVYPGAIAAKMMAYVTMGMSLVPMVAPTVGGFLAMAFGWESTFWLLLMSGLALLALIYFDMGETAPTSSGSFLDMAKGFPDLLTSQRFLGYALCSALASGAFFAFLGGAPFVGVQIFGISEAALGMGIGAPAIGYFFGNFLSARYSVRIGMNKMCLIGTLITFAGIALCALLVYTDHITVFWFFAPMVPLGFGNGLTMPNAITGSMSVRPKLTGTAAGLGGAMIIGGGAALSAFAGTFMSVDHGILPLLMIMMIVSLLSIIAILWVIHRERTLSL
ncbi:multidrug effflux MFS transporter [Pacificibacter marinus]|uniref:multidrug effflux MFS transporter n=1 Tax=Pacificibacter marinus TaxID=658057 RepID=UPI001C06DAEE|nr:multidrug effflux MFS transporter [Pacificibacter marinus]MBU2868865.1 multidrug effflux MFS transporter [Pacificibacter marinus]